MHLLGELIKTAAMGVDLLYRHVEFALLQAQLPERRNRLRPALLLVGATATFALLLRG
jgi:hypothetical protein